VELAGNDMKLFKPENVPVALRWKNITYQYVSLSHQPIRGSIVFGYERVFRTHQCH
jgi:hypothetical protein